MSVRRIWQVVVAGSLAANLAMAVILFTPVTEWLYRPLIVTEDPAPGDAIVVFASPDGAYNTPEGIGDFQTLVRLLKAFDLYRTGYAPRIICLGGDRLPASGRTMAEVMRNHLVSWGVPAEAVDIYDHHPGMWRYHTNIMEMLDKYADTIDFHTALFVTSSQNTSRFERYIAKKIGEPVHMVSADPVELMPRNWHHRFENFRNIFNEYYAHFEGWLTGRF